MKALITAVAFSAAA